MGEGVKMKVPVAKDVKVGFEALKVARGTARGRRVGGMWIWMGGWWWMDICVVVAVGSVVVEAGGYGCIC